jgi:hypothetical protein
MNAFSLHQEHNQEHNLHELLSKTTVEDVNLVTLRSDVAIKVLTNKPWIKNIEHGNQVCSGKFDN